MKNKGAKQKLKRKGAASAFGCDLTEYLESSGQDGKCLFILTLVAKEQSVCLPFFFFTGRTANRTFPRLRVRQPGAGLSPGNGVTAWLLTMNEQSEDCFVDVPA